MNCKLSTMFRVDKSYVDNLWFTHTKLLCSTCLPSNNATFSNKNRLLNTFSMTRGVMYPIYVPLIKPWMQGLLNANREI